MENFKNIEKLKPFAHFCCTIGNLPTSYMMSLTYEEQLLWLCQYLEKTVIPAINTNAEAVEEVQRLYTQLKEYVDNYFSSLDIQSEINNKLDEMAESGRLTEIIAQYLELAGILAFNNVYALKNAQNLNDGSFTKTYGKISYNDGLGNFYKIREVRNTDVPDDYNIIALNHYPNLIAERIRSSLDSRVDALEIPNQLRNRKFVFIGDSYDAFWNPEQEKGKWSDEVISILGLTASQYVQNALGGACFGNSQNSFYSLINSISNDEFVTDVVIAGGYNDQYYDLETLGTAMRNVDNLIKTKFPNARVHLGFIGWSKNGQTNKTLKTTIYNYIHLAKILNWHFLRNCEFSLHDYYSSFNYDGVHPTTYGIETIGRNIAEAILYGSASVQLEKTLGGTASGHCTSFGIASTKMLIKDNITSISNLGLSILDFSNVGLYITNGNTLLEVADIDSTLILGYDEALIPISGWAVDGTIRHNMVGYLLFQNGKLYLSFRDATGEGYQNILNLTRVVLLPFNHTLDSLCC